MNYIFMKNKLGMKGFKNLQYGRKFVLNTPHKKLKLKLTSEGGVFYNGKTPVTPVIQQIHESSNNIIQCLSRKPDSTKFEYIDINTRTGMITPVYEYKLADKFGFKNGYLINSNKEVYKFNQDSLISSKTDLKIDMNTIIRLSYSKVDQLAHVISKPVDGEEKFSVIDEKLNILCPFVFDSPKIERTIGIEDTKKGSMHSILGFQSRDKHVLVYNGKVFDEVPANLEYDILLDQKDRFAIVCAVDLNNDKSTVFTYVNSKLLDDVEKDKSHVRVLEEEYDGRVSQIIDINSSNLINKMLVIEKFNGKIYQYGVVDEQERVIIPFEYDNIAYSFDTNERILVKNSDKLYWNLKTGEIKNQEEKDLENKRLREEFERLQSQKC